MDTEKARDKLEEIKGRYQLGGDLEKVKVSPIYIFLQLTTFQEQMLATPVWK